MSSKIFNAFRSEIVDYCVKNRLSFDKLRKSPCCYDDSQIIIQYPTGSPEKAALGLMDNIPMPITLEIHLENGSLRFVQTDITRKYLGVAGETEKRTAAKRTPTREPALA